MDNAVYLCQFNGFQGLGTALYCEEGGIDSFLTYHSTQLSKRLELKRAYFFFLSVVL